MNDREQARQSVLRRALEKIDALDARLAQAGPAAGPIAVIGIGCRFPGGADGPAAFWRLLCDGFDATGPIPADRWDADAFYAADPEAPGKTNARRGAFLGGVDMFDPAFFGIAPREAAALDPQQRILLEVAWEALEHAGLPPARLAGTPAGVFIGVGTSEYAHLLRACGIEAIGSHHLSGTHVNFAAGRIAYCLGLNGPAMALDTACSSSLAAVHVACQSLRAGDCDLALAGGVNLILTPDGCVTATKIRMLAADGRCKTFDARADGFVRGEGCGVVVLKPLAAALAGGDRIFAVIRGSAANQDGASGGLTVPNIEAQKAVIRLALARAGVEPGDVGYVEAHGTGTALGDPLELRALAAVLCRDRPAGRPLVVGSVKTNIGHQESAAGIAGLIKAVLALHHGEIPPHLNFERPNPHVDWSELNVLVPTRSMPMPSAQGRPIVGVSAFGASGTNVHVVLGGAPEPEPVAEPRERKAAHLIPISARSDAALRALAKNYREVLTAEPPADAAYTASCGRNHFAHRLALVGDSPEQLCARIDAFLAGPSGGGDEPEGLAAGVVESAAPPRVAFLFTGQGSQYAGMGRELARREPVFREALGRCEEILGGRLGRPLREILDDAASLDRTALAQPALIALEWALAEQWRAWGIEPAAVLGHSVGEYAAACVAGVMDIEEALGLVCERGRLMGALPEAGAMAAVMAGEELVRPALAGAVAIAALNGPHQTVISGRSAAVQVVLERLVARGIEVRPLHVALAAHSPLVEPMLDAFDALVRAVAPRAPRVAWASPVTGGASAAGEPLPSDYWRRNVRETVRFAAAAAALDRGGVDAWLEIGPTPTLTGMARGFIGRGRWLPSLRRSRGDCVQMAESLGLLYTLGCPVDWAGWFKHFACRRVSLPTYPFERRRCWFTPAAAPRPQAQWVAPLIGRVTRSPLVRELICETPLDPAGLSLLADHRVGEQGVWPAAATLELAFEAAREAFGPEPVELLNVTIHEPLGLDSGRTLQCVLKPDDAGPFELTLVSIGASGGAHSVHAAARIRRAPVCPERAAPAVAADAVEWPVDAFYARLAGLGMRLGPDFQSVRRIRRRPGEAWAECGPCGAQFGAGARRSCVMAPQRLDACLQAFAATWLDEAGDALYLPLGFESVVVRADASGILSMHAVLREPAAAATRETLTGDVDVFDESGRLVAAIRGFAVKRVACNDALYELKWSELVLPTVDAPAGDGTWLIYGECNDCAARFAEKLRQCGETVVAACGADELPRLDASLKGVVYLAGRAPEAAGVESAKALAGVVPLQLVQALADRIGADFGGLWLVTRGAWAVGDAARGVDPGQGLLWGFGRTVAREHPEFRIRLVDLDPSAGAEPAAALANILRGADGDLPPELALRGERCFVPRLEALGSNPEPPVLELAVTTPGILDGLKLVPSDRRAPAPGEVEVAMAAAGLNFRDVMAALDMLPGPVPLGVEFAGRVVALGEGVSGLALGERVVGIAFGGAFRSRVTADARLVAPLPESIADAAAVTLPSAFMTAREALFETGGLKAGQSVLIHAAAGGVGLAAVALARRAGARIFATAGSPDKRRFLHSLGIEHVFDSRSSAFADGVREATGGRGVDLVLNSLTGDLMRLGLELVVPGGRFLEIGKTGLYSREQAAAINPAADYRVIDLVAACRRDPARMRAMLAALIAQVASGELEPLPRAEFALAAAAEAFRHMARARHVGKVVLTHAESAVWNAAIELHGAHAAFVIAGGTGGLGLATAEWLVGRGAKKIALVGRRAPSPAARERIGDMQKSGARVETYAADVACFGEIENVFERIHAELGPVRGVIHAAGAIEDAVLERQTPAAFDRVLAPKVAGAWNLHRLTRGLDLDFFVLYASAAALLGSAGQSAYTAACAFEDALAWHRRALGLPAVSIDWGPWDGIGMTAARRVAEQVRREGYESFAPADALDLFGRILSGAPAQVVALRHAPRAFESARHLWRPAPAQSESAPAGLGSRADIERQVREQVRRVLGLDPGQPLPARQGFASLGMDSLMSVELRNRLQRGLARTLPTTLTFDYPTVEAMTDYIAALDRPTADSFAAAVAGMSDEAAEALLAGELEQIQRKG